MIKKRSTNRASEKPPLKVEEVTQLLETIANSFPPTSKEYRAIELAAKALLYAYRDETQQKFSAFLDSFDADLSEEQKRRLIGMGIQI